MQQKTYVDKCECAASRAVRDRSISVSEFTRVTCEEAGDGEVGEETPNE